MKIKRIMKFGNILQKISFRNTMQQGRFLLAVLSIVCMGIADAQQLYSKARHINKNWHNPVLNKDFADPTVIRIANGKYYAYATQGKVMGKLFNMQVASSDDMFNWKTEGDALPQKPVWADKTSSFWAPHVLYDSAIKKYIMFFSSATNDTSLGKCMGVAFADTPTGPFIDKGSPLICGAGFINIDPMAFVDPATGKKLLYWGSGFQPIKVQELTDDWKDFKPGTARTPVVWPGKEKAYTILLEGAWVDYQDGKYYLYYSGDNCCGNNAHYAVMVARAENAYGPYERLGEKNGSGSSVILEQDKAWLAPGHNSIFSDGKGNKWIAFHAIGRNMLPEKNGNTRRVMLINRIVYKNGWPVVIKQQ